MKLHQLNRHGTLQPRDDGTRSPHILVAIDTLNAVWSGDFDTPDTIEAIRRTAETLITLAWQIEADTQTPTKTRKPDTQPPTKDRKPARDLP